ncbi:hypothetical protein ACFSPU_04845, partial [Haoranjiania flava]|uniref:hypothetical protein n=1 Tax=Haoranjiania flava TaxID=1856322 RepID=UPI0036285FA9
PLSKSDTISLLKSSLKVLCFLSARKFAFIIVDFFGQPMSGTHSTTLSIANSPLSINCRLPNISGV